MLVKNYFIGLLIFFSCSSVVKKTNRENEPIRAVRVAQNFANVSASGRLLGYDTFYTEIYYYKDQVLYRDFYHWASTKRITHIKDSSYHNVQTKTEIRQSFFVLTKGKTYGYFYDTNTHYLDRKMLADSFLAKQWYTNIGFAPITISNKAEKYDRRLGLLQVKYDFKGKVDTSMKGICFLYFSKKLAGIDYSLVKNADTMQNMKLCKLRNTTYSRYIKLNNITLDKIEQAFDLEEIPVNNKDEIMYYFNRERQYNQ